jgi:hypothetical protein
MTCRELRILVILGAAALTARADLYLLAASPNLKGLGSPYGASLIYVGSQGAVSEAREVASATPGVYWIGVSYEERKAVVVTDSLTPPLHLPKMIVVDFDKGDVVKTCEFNAWAESRLDTWLAVQPGMGLSLEWGTGSYDSANKVNVTLGGALVDPSVSCEKSMWTPQAEDARYLVASGWAGAAGGVSNDSGPLALVNMKTADGSVDIGLGYLVHLGYRIPLNLRKGREYSSALMANNRDVFCISLNGGLVYFRKSDQTWHEWKISSRLPQGVRSFGKYLAGTEVDSAASSAGRDEWRKVDSKTGPATAIATEFRPLPGRLLIYDTDSEKEFSIRTGQGDSEVILIQDGVVYYRAATRLYSAPLTKDGVGEGRLLATSELIRDAHWAFIKR